MIGSGDHSFIELDLNSERGMLSAIAEQVGPRVETIVGAVANVSRPPGSMTFRSNAEFASVVFAPSPNMEAAFASDRLQRFDAPVGMLVINPSNVDRTLRWATQKKNAAIAFGPAAYSNLAMTELDGAEWELQPPRFGRVDLRALRLARAMVSEVSEESTNELYLDSLITVFGVHLLRNYSNANAKQSNLRYRRLSLQTSRRVIEFMNEHIAEKLSINAIAKISRMSPGHFIRAFRMTFGIPPHQYLVNIRLQKAERLLTESELPISDIAFQSGFSSQSHLTNTMKRYKQMTPRKIRTGRE
jgi:AraC family transcriptional regulator